MTGFFHVPSAFGVLEEKVIPALFSDKSSKEPIRVWVAGCATGEEAYSVAILLFEYASTINASPTIEIYATDNDQESLNIAQSGLYTGAIVDQMSSVCLNKYFLPEGEGFSLKPEIRKAVHFSSHDVLIDNSFQSFDLITCRHLLAYLDQTSQSQIVTFFHHSLRPNGFLFLGDAEFAQSLPSQFESVDNVFKIYQLNDAEAKYHIDSIIDDEEEEDTLPKLSPESEAMISEEIHKKISEEHGDGLLVKPMAEMQVEAELDEAEIGTESLSVQPQVEEKALVDEETLIVEEAIFEDEALIEDDDTPTLPVLGTAIENVLDSGSPAETESGPLFSVEDPEEDFVDLNLEPLNDLSDDGLFVDESPAEDVLEVVEPGENHLLEQELVEADLPEPEEVSDDFDLDEGLLETAVSNFMANEDSLAGDSGMDALPELDHGRVDDALTEVDESGEDRQQQEVVEAMAEHLVEARVSGQGSEDGGFASISVDSPFTEESTSVSRQRPEPSHEILSQLHRSVMLQDYAPASLLIDRSFRILDHTGRIDRVFDISHSDLTKDYLDKLPDFYRLNLEETLNQIFHEQDKNAVPTLHLPGLPGKKDVLLEMQFMSSPDPSLEIVHVLFKEKQHVKQKQEGATEDTVSFFASPAGVGSQVNGTFGGEVSKGTFEDDFFRSVRTSPFPMLLHIEGGNIIELSKPWIEMAGVTKDEAPTISAWTKRVKGQRLRLKDSKLKESYHERGVVCISIRNKMGDTKLLAFHSTYLGLDNKGRKLTLTMAVDITNYPGHSGMGITPEVADFGVAAKKTFLANMSHEVRTPLTSMIGFADYLSDKLTGQDVQFARYISESGNRLLETLNAVLRIASLDGSEQVMRHEMLDVTVEAQGVLQLFKPYAEQYGIPLKLVVEQPAKAKIDRAAFRRILSNLLGNAIKFTPEGEVTITVNSDVDSVIVEIEDTGIGITDEFLPFIFDRFAQESKGQGRAYSGCGLGLSICKQLVEAMEGTIQVETEAGVGSKFTVRLPKEPNQRSQSTGVITSGPAHGDQQENRPQILIVEDNTDTQELMLLILRDKYNVTITSNATETLAIIQQRTFDAILMDLNLGGRRTGFELIRELRQVNAYQTIPVLAVSALPIGVIRKQLIREGFNGYIAKPFTRARILDALEGVLNLSA